MTEAPRMVQIEPSVVAMARASFWPRVNVPKYGTEEPAMSSMVRLAGPLRAE